MTFKPTIGTLILAFVLGFAVGKGGLPDFVPDLIPDTVSPSPTVEATAATYVYEKDQHAVPSYVLGAFNKLNRGERPILATLLEADPQDGTGDVPDQYKVALAAAKEAGLPALVVTAGDKVLAVVKSPESEQAIIEAVTK